METVEVIYKVKTAAADEILMHLEGCSNSFHPPLTGRVNLEEYSRKIFEKAITFEAWNGNVLVGLLAAYFSDSSNLCAYITNVSVLDRFMRLGIASRLLMQCVEYAVKENFKEIQLEVNKENSRAIDMYRKFNFTFDEVGEGFLKMRVKLIAQSKANIYNK